MEDANAPAAPESSLGAGSLKTSASVPGPARRQDAAFAGISSKINTQTEVPRAPKAVSEFELRAPTEPLALGNKHYETMHLLEGRYGIFYARDKAENPLTWFELNANNFRTSVAATLRSALFRLMVNKGYEDDDDIERRLNRVVPVLIRGVCLMTYLKIRAVNLAISTAGDRYILKPKVPEPFEVPLPFAIAISQLGAFEINSLAERKIAIPGLSDADATARLLDGRFTAAEYAHATEFAKSLGIQFSAVDLDVKLGSAWWMFRATPVDEVFTLICPLPESNFTETNSLIYLMFCVNQDGSFGTQLFALGDYAATDYGSMLRNPHDGANVNAFFAFSDDPLTALAKLG
ncbi:coat protein 2 [Silvergrass cryptic virus 1]|nr:coat protein 2 [Silvergrass cryptic virus 1]